MRPFLYKTLFAFSLGLILPQTVFAAQMSFDAKTTRVQIGERFEVGLFINTGRESINAFEGNIIFPADILDLKEIRDGNSIVNLWVEKPKNQNGAVIFSGVTPGGFNGENGLIFSAIFETKKEEIARFEINDARVLRNDGTGSMAPLTIAPFEVVVSEGAPAKISTLPKVKDRERPESFVPEITKDETLFDGRWFVVFVTQDKASGVDHYEIKESRQNFFAVFQKWLPAESPHVLQDQELRSFVFVKAVDKASNERIIKIEPRNPLPWYENYDDWIIIIVGVLVAMFITKKLWRGGHISEY